MATTRQYRVESDFWGADPQYTRGQTVEVTDGKFPYDVEHAVRRGILVELDRENQPVEMRADPGEQPIRETTGLLPSGDTAGPVLGSVVRMDEAGVPVPAEEQPAMMTEAEDAPPPPLAPKGAKADPKDGGKSGARD